MSVLLSAYYALLIRPTIIPIILTLANKLLWTIGVHGILEARISLH